MRIGVLSDTHNNLANVSRIVEILNGQRVDRVVHTGDITQAKTLEVLARLEAPLLAVYGNNDLPERPSLDLAADRLGIQLCEPPLHLDWADRRVWVVHDPRDFEKTLPEAHATDGGPDLILHGHDHLHRLEEHGRTLVFNPGECAGHTRGRNAIGLVDLVELECETLFF
jgi:putative phosphoesterase